tara:strand:+ start:157 stop:705 length:549 start_codon:yes stop_codon:yes gene_type:complete
MNKKSKVVKQSMNSAIEIETTKLSQYDSIFRNHVIKNSLDTVIDTSFIIDVKTLSEHKATINERIKKSIETKIDDTLFHTAVMIEVTKLQDKKLVATSSRMKSDYDDTQLNLIEKSKKSIIDNFNAIDKKSINKIEYAKGKTIANLFYHEDSNSVRCIVKDFKTNSFVEKELKVYWNTVKQK